MEKELKSFLKEVKFDSRGLIPAIIQDEKGKVLMLGYMNEEAIKKTLETGKVHFFSRSRERLWLKGETSKNYIYMKEIKIDCDGDTILIKGRPTVGVCHEGYYSCFHRKWKKDKWILTDKKVFEPEEVYGKS